MIATDLDGTLLAGKSNLPEGNIIALKRAMEAGVQVVIASGRSTIQVRTLADEVEEKLSEMGEEPLRKEGQQDGRWVVLDYGTVLVHIFHTQEREFYRLDKLWESDQNRIALPFVEEDE